MVPSISTADHASDVQTERSAKRSVPVTDYSTHITDLGLNSVRSALKGTFGTFKDLFSVPYDLVSNLKICYIVNKNVSKSDHKKSQICPIWYYSDEM